MFFARSLCCLVVVQLLSHVAFAQHPLGSADPRVGKGFLLRAEEAIDDLKATDVNSYDRQFDSDLKAYDNVRNSLGREVSNETEKKVAQGLAMLSFALYSCHVIARNGGSTAECEARIAGDTKDLLGVLGRHKELGVWTDGAP